MKKLDDFFLKHDEATNACLVALKDVISRHDPDISFSWKYNMPFFNYKNKMFCYS